MVSDGFRGSMAHDGTGTKPKMSFSRPVLLLRNRPVRKRASIIPRLIPDGPSLRARRRAKARQNVRPSFLGELLMNLNLGHGRPWDS